MATFTAHQAKYFAHELTRRHGEGGVDRLSQSLFDASVDLNPHQIEAALFALRNPLQEGVLLADEVGLGKTIEAALVLCQYWAERKRNLLIICPASLRKQWAQELVEKFAVPSTVVDATVLRKQNVGGSFNTLQTLAKQGVLIMSYHFAARLEAELRAVPWDVVVIDEAHKLRNAHRESNRMGQALKRALAGRKKLLLTATPLQNSLMELYGLSTLLDEHLFGDDVAFRKQYMNGEGDIAELRVRMKGFVNRTLRKDVLEYVKYTERKAFTQPFEPTDDEQALYNAVSEFLQRPFSFALPKQQRHLTGLILHKLLASSPEAVAATLSTIVERLERLLHGDEELSDNLVAKFIEEDELSLDKEEWEEEFTIDDCELAEPAAPYSSQAAAKRALQEEINELNSFIARAKNLTVDTKAKALLKALTHGFAQMAELGAPRKAIIFTESKRTQAYLSQYLAEHGYADKLVLFSGSNNSPEATAIYQGWLTENEGSDRVTGSPQVDRRTALIDHFRKDDGTGAEIMIATEAAAEGVNLQFCALLINYDLPWNPQRVEQRIGRCHRYGQKFDVVVINFLNTRNRADQRVLELLTEKFNLFSGVFGASDEVLGRVESGVDFEKRILQIYSTCRSSEDIEEAFSQLQSELEDSINSRIEETQSQLLEYFDEDVHDRLKLRLDEAQARLDKLGRWFWEVTRFALNKRARFDEHSYAFSLLEPPANTQAGRYQLIRGAAQPDMLAHAYRLSHPLGQWSIDTSLNAPTPLVAIDFNYSEHSTRISVIENLKGQSGWLCLVKAQVTTAQTTDALLFSGLTDTGAVLDQDTCEKLMSLAATSNAQTVTEAIPSNLQANAKRYTEAFIAEVLENNQRLFNEERDKLERWAEDKINAAEETLRNTKARISQLKREARKATSMQEQDSIQREIAEQERKQRRQRQEIFNVEDEIIEQRDALIDSLQERLQEKTEQQTLFTLRWQVV